MNKNDIVDKITRELGYPKSAVENVVDKFLDSICDGLSSRSRVSIRGFGSFEAVYRKSRRGRDIVRKESIVIPERYVPVFKPGTELKNIVNPH